MTFAHPYLLLLLILLPLLAWLKGRYGARPAFLYSSVQLVKGITGITRSHRGQLVVHLRWLALALLIVALARPQLIEGQARLRASGIDIVIALDCSRSMASEDFTLNRQRVNRLDLAQHVLDRFLSQRPNDRIGLVAFAGRAYIAAPLTLDHDFLRQNLERLELSSIQDDGTAIGSALATAVNRLRPLPSKSRLVILMTDGQNNSGQIPPLTAALAAQALGIKVYTIGVGTRGTAPYPQYRGGQKFYVSVPVDIDEETLRQIAEHTGGRYFRATDTDQLLSIYREIDQLEKTEADMRKQQRFEDVFDWIVLPALFVLLLETLLAHTVWRKLP
ncbi:MAG TPA: VWA domain-containing protein [Candidatus Paceibacterota bacterium]|nr:VWA domain-containing protein [Verrucomicrobiota bacterium]HOX02959.1 VWA domain-containing protein [Verrucomicrobiota bacterium]HRZ45711.1 VWA domain-containing protein [Candidatus Paceibacterota bacterium]